MSEDECTCELCTICGGHVCGNCAQYDKHLEEIALDALWRKEAKRLAEIEAAVAVFGEEARG
jgi:hypothetical protein